MNSFYDLKQNEDKKEQGEKERKKYVEDILISVGKWSAPKKLKELFYFSGTVKELKNKLKIYE